ncbi:capsule biosynthesis GfcC family protein [Thiomicrorhabdus sediminis]|uniref:Uncharacterized protein n=1 Tax=Thiomicrorhabdus sediminis TaxID=2580412 RepID=A0A4P9K3Q2_9GAMM|nr:capsule biosynthesis GfcC family protein [Thiomicrorhabdus sediminis]QCU89554.1 hypothetical protein FE785_02330 [Thiomicrorhabdus sediminis]
MDQYHTRIYRALKLLFFVSICAGIPSISSAFTVQVDGCVAEPKIFQVDAKISLLDVLKNTELTSCAYVLGTSWSMASLEQQQAQQKRALLSQIEHEMSEADSAATIEYLQALFELIVKQPVTGRVLPSDFDSFHVEAMPQKNRVLTQESTIYFPSQPKKINLVGFSQSQRTYDSDLSTTDIYNEMDICSDCTHGWLWSVQPDGEVKKHKVGVWTTGKNYVAPGGWLISPLSGVDDSFYQQLTLWLATQEVLQ